VDTPPERGDGSGARLLAALSAHAVRWRRQKRGASPPDRGDPPAAGFWRLSDDNGALTDAGRDARERVEQLTDETAVAAYPDLDGSELDTFEAALAPITSAVLASGALPRFNPIGLDAAPPAR
jgi:hypothetical protein